MNTSDRERIERYIKKTKLSPEITDTYCLYHSDMCVFVEEMNRDWYRAMCMMFDYGLAKGYRAAKAEMRRG